MVSNPVTERQASLYGAAVLAGRGPGRSVLTGHLCEGPQMVEPFITARLVQCGVGIVIDQSYNASRAPAYPRLVGLGLRRSGIDRTEGSRGQDTRRI